MARLFFALQPTVPERAVMHAAVASELEQVGARPLPAEDLHLTLCFLGEVEPPTVEVLAEALPLLDEPACALSLDRLDWWHTSGVLCLLPRDDGALGQVAALAGKLRDAARGAGISIETRPFRAHVTLGRKVNTATAAAQVWPRVLARPLPFSAGGVALMRSSGRGEGPRYAVVRRWPYPVRDGLPP